MRFYTKQHQFYCGIDLHSRLLAICILDQVLLADLDGDRRLDIIATAERAANELRWWQNSLPTHKN
jgi:hypothetical protein